jgi:hypothetical protein
MLLRSKPSLKTIHGPLRESADLRLDVISRPVLFIAPIDCSDLLEEGANFLPHARVIVRAAFEHGQKAIA